LNVDISHRLFIITFLYLYSSMSMEYRRLGSAGVQVSALSLGSWLTFGSQISNDVAEALMIRAYDAGVNFFDNAEAYAHGRSEQVMGSILKKLDWDRSTYLVSSKAYWGGEKPNQIGLSRKHVVEACNAALRRLQVEYLDFFFCHRPDKNTPIEETVWAMNLLIQQGKVLYWGTSEWSAQEIMEAYAVARQYNVIPPQMEQPQYNMLHRERFEAEYRHLYSRIGLGTTTWSPLASGLISEKYLDNASAQARLNRPGLEWLKDTVLKNNALQKVQALQPIANELGLRLPQLGIAWCLANPNVSTVILGATSVDQLRENLGALDAVPKLTTPVLEEIENILLNKPVISQY
jgi:voltage-dependent potassium channel beta subunit